MSAYLPHCPLFDALFEHLASEDAFHVNARRHHLVGIELAHFNQLFHFGDGDFRGSRHHGIKVARRLAIDQIAPLVALPRFDECEVGAESALHNVRAPVELADFLSVADHGSVACRREECWNTRTAGANTLGKSSLRIQLQLDRALQHHLFKKFVFPDVGTDMFSDLSIAEKKSQTETVDAHVIRDRGEVLRPLLHERTDKILRNAAQAKSADHDGSAILDVANRLVCGCDHFLHDRAALSRRPLISSPSSISPIGHEPKPESALMCPPGPAFSSLLPQAAANSRARSMVSHGSLLLATRMEENGSLLIGMGRKSCSASGASARARSVGATRRAPRTGRECFAAQCAIVAQPRECATNTGGAEQPAMAASKLATQSSRLGISQFFC